MFDCNFKNLLTAIRRSLLAKVGLRVVVPTLFLSACAIATELYDPTPLPPVPFMPVPVAPAGGIELSQFDEVVFSWQAAEHAERYEFHVFNSLTKDTKRYLLTGLKPSETCVNDICSVSLRLDMPESTRHAWRVRAINESGASPWTRKLFSWES